MTTGYFLIAEILGFSNIVKNLSDDKLNTRMNDWTNLVKKLGDKYGFTNYQLLSDTLFLSVENNDDETFKKLINYCRDLLSEGISKFIPIKGALTHGSYEWGNFVYGKTVIDGHEIESMQNWIGITLKNEIPNVEANWATDKIICYPTPMKAGNIKLYPVVAWDVPSFDDLIELTTGNGLMNKSELPSWNWAEKIKNTLEFKIYLDILKGQVLKDLSTNGQHFIGFMPIQIIERAIKAQQHKLKEVL